MRNMYKIIYPNSSFFKFVENIELVESKIYIIENQLFNDIINLFY